MHRSAKQGQHQQALLSAFAVYGMLPTSSFRSRRPLDFRGAIQKPEPVVSGNASSTLLRIEKNMAEGSIKRLTDKGFGFIEIAPGQDLFFHSSGVVGTSFDQLYEGQQVSFTEGQGPKGPRADNVTPV